jgi:hypothetical protein
MLDYFSKTRTMSFEDFGKLQHGEITLKDIMKKNDSNKDIETLAGRILNDNRARRFVTALMGSVFYGYRVLAESESKGIDPLGMKFLGLIRHWAYWILLIMCIVEIVRSGLSGDSKKILGIVMKFLIIFGSMYLVPELFDAIKTAF